MRAKRAQVLVEFAIVLPFLVLILAAVLDVGFWVYDVIGTHAALRSAVYAASQARPDGSPVYDDAQIAAIADEAHGPVFPLLPGELTVTRRVNDPQLGGASVTVAVRHEHRLIVPVLVPLGPVMTIRSSLRVPLLSR